MDDREFRDKMIDSMARVQTMLEKQDQRLWGHDGQPGVIPTLYQQVTDNNSRLEKKIEDLKTQQTAFDKVITVTTWKLGTISAAGGAALAFGLQWLGKKMFHVS